MDLLDTLYDIADQLPKHELYRFGSQIRGVAVSIPANIAEGHGQNHIGNYLQSLSIAHGSVMEGDTLMEVCSRRKYVPIDQVVEAIAQLARQGRIQSGLMSSLRKYYHPK